MSSNIVLGRELKSLSEQLNLLQDQLNTSRDLINSYASSANSARSKGTYDTYVNKYNTEKSNFDNLLADYEEAGGQYSTTLEKYNTISFSNKAQVITHELPNAKDSSQWLAGGEFYNEKNPGGYVWSATNPLSPDERPTQDLGLVINRGNVHSYLNEGFTQVQNELRGFGFLDLLGDYTVSETVIHEVTMKVVTKDGSIHEFTTFVDGDGKDKINNYNQSNNTTIETISNIMNSPYMDLTTLNAIGLAQFTITNLINGKLYNSGRLQIGDIIAASLYHTTKDIFSQKLTFGISQALGLKNLYAIGLLNVGVSALVGEVLEMAMGYDVSFGYGGEYSKEASKNFGKDAFGESKGFMGLETLSNRISYELGFKDSFTQDWTDKEGNVLGTSITQNGGLEDNEFTGFGETYNQAMADLEDKITQDFGFEYGLSFFDSGGLNSGLTSSDIDEDWNDSDFGFHNNLNSINERSFSSKRWSSDGSSKGGHKGHASGMGGKAF